MKKVEWTNSFNLLHWIMKKNTNQLKVYTIIHVVAIENSEMRKQQVELIFKIKVYVEIISRKYLEKSIWIFSWKLIFAWNDVG